MNGTDDLGDLSNPLAPQRWWWDVRLGQAVPDHDKGPERDLLGPYPSREAAEAWRDSHETREEAWTEEEERWEGDDEEGGSEPAS